MASSDHPVASHDPGTKCDLRDTSPFQAVRCVTGLNSPCYTSLQIANIGGGMRLAEKLRHLREIEGQLRGRGRPLSKTEVVSLMKSEIGESLSLPYLSQIESGARPHLTASSRELLARFFRVHPSYLVSDPERLRRVAFLTGRVADLQSDRLVGSTSRGAARRSGALRSAVEAGLEPDPRATLIALGHVLAEQRPPSAVETERSGVQHA